MILQKRFREFYRRFISLKGDASSIASGLAIGVFIGATPTIPFHTALIILAGLLFRRNITAGLLGSWMVSNPLTIPILYLSQYELGRVLLEMPRCSFEIADYTLGGIAALGWQILLPLQVGGIVMAPFFAVPAYFVALKLIAAVRRGENA